MYFRRGAGFVAALLVSAGLAAGCSSTTYRDINYGSDLGRGWVPEAGPLDADGGAAGSTGADGAAPDGTGGGGTGGAGGSGGGAGDAGPADGGDDAADALDNS
ncbi:MAG TPA: hypothetical protein VMU50_13265 [Polyangia bacterium]|nr:hypothetical protein [Polyangia bacterium]